MFLAHPFYGKVVYRPKQHPSSVRSQEEERTMLLLGPYCPDRVYGMMIGHLYCCPQCEKFLIIGLLNKGPVLCFLETLMSCANWGAILLSMSRRQLFLDKLLHFACLVYYAVGGVLRVTGLFLYQVKYSTKSWHLRHKAMLLQYVIKSSPVRKAGSFCDVLKAIP